MKQLIVQIRAAMPFDLTDEQICADSCAGCSIKLLTFLEGELDAWEWRLQEGERPNFGDLNKLAKTSKKIFRVLRKNGFAGDAAAYKNSPG